MAAKILKVSGWISRLKKTQLAHLKGQDIVKKKSGYDHILVKLALHKQNVFHKNPAPNDRCAMVGILSYNIHSGVGTDGAYDLERVSGVIRRSDADIACLQEAFGCTGFDTDSQ